MRCRMREIASMNGDEDCLGMERERECVSVEIKKHRVSRRDERQEDERSGADKRPFSY